MGELHAHPQRLAQIQQLPGGVENLGRVAADVGGHELVRAPEGLGGAQQLVDGDAGVVADAVGDAETASAEAAGDALAHPLDLLLRGGCVPVLRAAVLPEVAVSGQHTHIYAGAVPIHQIEVIPRVTGVVAAVSSHGGGHAHAQHTGENAALLVVHNAPVGPHGILVHVDIHKPGTDDLPGGVDGLIGGIILRAHGGHMAVGEQQVEPGVNPVGGVDHKPVDDECFHALPAFPKEYYPILCRYPPTAHCIITHEHNKSKGTGMVIIFRPIFTAAREGGGVLLWMPQAFRRMFLRIAKSHDFRKEKP